MTKQLSIAAALLLAMSCKTDTSSQPGAGAAQDSTAKARLAKIDVQPGPASLPAPGGGGDASGSGVTEEQRAAALHNRIANLRSRMDLDGDGKLTVDELVKARGRMHFDDPAAIDTNHDGDISADELAAALRARRDRRATARGSAEPAQ
jgi:EF hand domain-containing protein